MRNLLKREKRNYLCDMKIELYDMPFEVEYSSQKVGCNTDRGVQEYNEVKITGLWFRGINVSNMLLNKELYSELTQIVDERI